MKILFTSIFFIATVAILAQDVKVTRDLQSHVFLSTCYKPGKKIEFTGSYKTELKKDISYFDQHSLMLSTKYLLNNYLAFKLGLGYTWNYGYQSNVWRGYARTNLDGLLKYSLNRFNFYYRARVQNNDDDFSGDFDNEDLWIFRNRIKTSYNIRKSKLYPYVSVEHYMKITGDESYENSFKATLAIKHKLNKKNVFDYGYQFKQEITSFHPYTYHVILVKYAFILTKR